MYVWGYNRRGQLCKGDTESVRSPVKLDFFDRKDVRKIVRGKCHAIFVCDDGVYASGYNHYGQLGKGDYIRALSPVKLDFFDGKDVRKISCGYHHTMVVCNDGVYAWGFNAYGQVGKGDTENALSPVKLEYFSGKVVSKISCGAHYTMAVCNDGVYAWGWNSSGQLGKGDTNDASSPVKLNLFDGKDICKISCGGWHTIAVCNDGVYAWGENESGQLGNGDTENSFTPTKLDFFNLKDVLGISSGESHTVAVCSDGVYAWGEKSYYGNNLEYFKEVLSPKKIPGIDFNVEKVYCGKGVTWIKKAKPMVKAAIPPVMRRV